MKMLTRAPNNFINAAPPPRRLHAPHPCRGNIASRLGWHADDAAAPEIEITPPYTDVNCYHDSLHAQKNRNTLLENAPAKEPQGAIYVAPQTLLDNAPAKEPPRGYSRCTKMTMTARLQTALQLKRRNMS